MRLTDRRFDIDAGILTSVVLLAAFRESSASEVEASRRVWVSGVVRDLPERHPDFEQVPDHGFGLYAGNVDTRLGADGKPVHTGAGRRIGEPARDAHGRPIAPYLANRRYAGADEDGGHGGPDIPTDDVCETLEDSSGRDAYEVCLQSATNNPDGTSTWVYSVAELPGGKDLSHWNVKLDPGHTVLPGTTDGYDFGVDGSTGFFGIKWDVAESFDGGEFTIVLDGHFVAEADPAGVLAKGGNRADTGTMVVPSATPAPHGGGGGGDLVDDPGLGDTPADIRFSDTGGVASGTSFDQWFRDELGVNLSGPVTLEFERRDDGVYVFDDSADPRYRDLGGFYPVDDRMLGAEGGADHNHHFTVELRTQFTYDADAGQFLRLAVDDSAWVFIDGKLAVDLGGVGAPTASAPAQQHIDVDRLGLADGQEYTLDIFYADRHSAGASMRIETNLMLEPGPNAAFPSMTAAFD